MRKAALLYNPDSGGSRAARRQKDLESVLALLHNAGVDAELVLTHSRAHACEQTRRVILDDCDTVFACGGDGTIHNIVQVLANSSVALAILPMGTANALAHDQGVPNNIVAAAKVALNGTPRRIALGRVEFFDFDGKLGTRYFIVSAGMGVDAHLFYKLHSGTKQRLGMAAYYAKAWRLWMTYPMTRFLVDYEETGSPEGKNSSKQANVTELMAIRIRNFGGVLQELAPGASLERDDLRLVFCRTASRMAYLHYVTCGLLRRQWKVPGIDLAYSKKVSCEPISSGAASKQQTIYVEADGELLGTLPATITIVQDALTLLTPFQK